MNPRTELTSWYFQPSVAIKWNEPVAFLEWHDVTFSALSVGPVQLYQILVNLAPHQNLHCFSTFIFDFCLFYLHSFDLDSLICIFYTSLSSITSPYITTLSLEIMNVIFWRVYSIVSFASSLPSIITTHSFACRLLNRVFGLYQPLNGGWRTSSTFGLVDDRRKVLYKWRAHEVGLQQARQSGSYSESINLNYVIWAPHPVWVQFFTSVESLLLVLVGMLVAFDS